MPKFLIEASLTSQGVKGVQNEEVPRAGKRCPRPWRVSAGTSRASISGSVTTMSS